MSVFKYATNNIMSVGEDALWTRYPSLNMVRVYLPSTILKVAIWVSIISVIMFSYQLIFSGSYTRESLRPVNLSLQANLYRHKPPPVVLPSTIPAPAATTLDPRMVNKIQRLHRHLNRTQKVDVNIFPAIKAGNIILVNPGICKDASVIDIVIIVHTSTNHYEDRQRIRDSFGKKSSFFPFQVRVAFLLGLTADANVESVLMMEQTRHGDLVMGNFIDSYHNLTLKGVTGYRWVSEYCPNSKYVLKIDDDVLINMYKLLYSFLNHMHGKPRSIFCNVWSNNSMPILREGKWKVPNHIFKKLAVFPYDYCSGFVVMMTTDLMAPMYEAARRTPFFWIDDVYLFGILPSVVGGVTYYNYALDRNMTLNDKVALNCTEQKGAQCPIFATIISQAAYWKLWGMIQNIYAVMPWAPEARVVS